MGGFRQLIVLSHYPRFLRSFFDHASAGGHSLRVAKLVKTASGSHVRDADAQDFVETDHHRSYRRIRQFAERQLEDDVSRDLRVFLEQELRFRFRRTIDAHGLARRPPKDIVDELNAQSVLSNDQRTEFHDLRISLNPEHHKWTDRTVDERVRLAKDVIEFVYERL